MNQKYRKRIANVTALATLMLTSSCGFRYIVAKPPQMQSEKKIVSSKQFLNIPKSEPILKLDNEAVLPQCLKKNAKQQIYNP